MLRYLRIASLLTLLLIVAGSQWLTENRLSSWEKPLWMTIYPVLADTDADTRRYAENLTPESFADIGQFIGQQASYYGRRLETPLVVQVARPLTELPPALPTQSTGLRVALWSLKMRWWAWRNGSQDDLASADVRMFVIYQNRDTSHRLERSVGIKKGSYGLVNAVASRQKNAHNRIVITHELLHIIGASDKYDFYTGQPNATDGLANPAKSPLYPQSHAEIMSGRIATSATRWRRPATLKSCVIGTTTAAEIGWL